jgi:hypothetical protein
LCASVGIKKECLHTEEIHALRSSLDWFREIKSWKIKWMENKLILVEGEKYVGDFGGETCRKDPPGRS